MRYLITEQQMYGQKYGTGDDRNPQQNGCGIIYYTQCGQSSVTKRFAEFIRITERPQGLSHGLRLRQSILAAEHPRTAENMIGQFTADTSTIRRPQEMSAYAAQIQLDQLIW